jgi:hypothetical protein
MSGLFSRLNHNSRLAQKSLTKWVGLHYQARLPRTGNARVSSPWTGDWTSEDDQSLLTISLVIGRRALSAF